MTGLFNTIGHETEGQTGFAAATVFDALSTVNSMLSKVELKDIGSANMERQKAVALLSTAATQFDALAADANDQPLFVSIPTTSVSVAELNELKEQLGRRDISIAMRNRDLFQIAGRELRALMSVIEQAFFLGRHSDWYSMRDVIRQMNRLTGLGVVLSRIASLHGNDPQLLN